MADPVRIGPYAFRYDGQRWCSANLATATSTPYDTAQVMITEIERLRAEVAKRQALIDAFVAVDQNPDDTGWDDAYNALLAAATKGTEQ